MGVGVVVRPNGGVPVLGASQKGRAATPAGTTPPTRVLPIGIMASPVGPIHLTGMVVCTAIGVRDIMAMPTTRVLLLLKRILRGLRRGAMTPSLGITIPPTMKAQVRVSRVRVMRFAARSPSGGLMQCATGPMHTTFGTGNILNPTSEPQILGAKDLAMTLMAYVFL